MSDMTVIETEDLKALFDLAVSSMDFGSGFLDSDEVSMLRRVAVTIGVDPWVATPHLFRSQFPHPYEEKEWYVGYCSFCNAGRESSCHG